MESATSRKILGKIRDSVARQGWEVEFLDTTAYDLKKPARRLDQLLDGHPNAIWLFVIAPSSVIRWAERNEGRASGWALAPRRMGPMQNGGCEWAGVPRW